MYQGLEPFRLDYGRVNYELPAHTSMHPSFRDPPPNTGSRKFGVIFPQIPWHLPNQRSSPAPSTDPPRAFRSMSRSAGICSATPGVWRFDAHPLNPAFRRSMAMRGGEAKKRLSVYRHCDMAHLEALLTASTGSNSLVQISWTRH